MYTHWIALYSGTGSEIYNLSKYLGKCPNVVITTAETIDSDLKELLISNRSLIIRCSKNLNDSDYHRWFLSTPKDTTLITLNGWMKIVPPNICKEYTIYNLHPGDIVNHPELKGKDPQLRAFNGKYKTAGCVIHKVDPEVDGGKIECVRRDFKFYKYKTLDEAIQALHTLAFKTWITFFTMIGFIKSPEPVSLGDIITLKFFKLFRCN